MAPSTTRRRLLATVAASGLAGCTGSPDGDSDSGDDESGSDGDGGGSDADGTDGGDEAGDGTDGEQPDLDLPEAVAFEPIVQGLEAPVSMAVAPSEDLQYLLEQQGRVRAVGPDGLLDEPVLDLSDAVTVGFEMGLLGLALHPDFAENRRAFVRYSAPSREGTPDDYSHTFVLAEFEATDDGRSFDPDSERTILELPQPQENHNAGDLTFGPDGLLYVPTGDGGAANDQGVGHADDWYDAVDGGNGQDVTTNRLGGLLRIDVDETDGDRAYAIPEDNPLVGTDGLDEYFAWGLRNPWRLSFDRLPGEDLADAEGRGATDGVDCYVADVGQADYEEVNLLEAGANYGWNVREGAHCFQAEDCPTETPDDVRGGEALVDPVIEYSQEGGEVTGISVIGGHVYRGTELPGLQGTYVFGDWQPGGRLFASRPAAEGTWPVETIAIEGASPQQLLSFGRDADGELYALGVDDEGGSVWRIEPA